MASLSFSIDGGASLNVTLTELEDGSIRFDLQNAGELLADLRGLFFDTTNSSLLSSLSVVGTDVTASAFRDDAVVNLGGGVTMSGAGNFDIGVAFGTAGIGKDDIDGTSFVLKSSTGALTLADFAGAAFGVRFTSVGEEGDREDSLKLVTTAPPVPDEPPVVILSVNPDHFVVM
jgi:hypothetical protein